ncbi:MAG: GMC family oxidoreductase N-terminal domain-containing protein [Sorangiineae bacterium]|nr:GMC family oxidoreductase N-terminal domain-containing protein [Polyangiaceae bacterium]MEB2322970.1 GMC family oxidoreductase N-terminal domain-containing protein [Sorangiineae bacterium]
MSGELVDLSRRTEPRRVDAEICVIGSGCGGATAARVLAEAGHEVVVLEEGGDYTGPELTQRDGAMYDQLYMDRGGRMTDNRAVSILQGRVLGGGGVINACDVVPIPDGVLEFWRRRHGLTEFTEAALSPHRAAALEDLSASRILDSQLNRANQLLRSGAEALGLRGENMMHNRVGCIGLGTCLIGCPANAKRNPRFVSIPRALEVGVRFFTRARAVRIDDGTRELKRVRARTLDPRGYHEQRDFEVRAKIVILAANAIGSAALLLRSGLGNSRVGRDVSLQPQIPVTGLFDERVDAFRGIPQAYAVTHHERIDAERGLSGFRIEAIMGTPGIVSTLFPFTGAEGKTLMTTYAHVAAALCLVPDEATGTVEVSNAGRPVVRYQQSAEHKQRMREAVRVAARIYLAAGATRVLVPASRPIELRSEADLDRVDALTLEPATAPLLSAHQQGGVRFAASASRGAADPDGCVYGTRGVYVFDSSGFPSTSSTHTMTPIITVSRYLSAKLSASLG